MNFPMLDEFNPNPKRNNDPGHGPSPIRRLYLPTVGFPSSFYSLYKTSKSINFVLFILYKIFIQKLFLKYLHFEYTLVKYIKNLLLKNILPIVHHYLLILSHFVLNRFVRQAQIVVHEFEFYFSQIPCQVVVDKTS